MNAARACVILGALTSTALALVAIRAEQARCAAATVRLESRWVELRRRDWAVQSRVARLRSPRRIHERVALSHPDLFPPSIPVAAGPPVRLAYRTDQE